MHPKNFKNHLKMHTHYMLLLLLCVCVYVCVIKHVLMSNDPSLKYFFTSLQLPSNSEQIVPPRRPSKGCTNCCGDPERHLL